MNQINILSYRPYFVGDLPAWHFIYDLFQFHTDCGAGPEVGKLCLDIIDTIRSTSLAELVRLGADEFVSDEVEVEVHDIASQLGNLFDAAEAYLDEFASEEEEEEEEEDDDGDW